MFDEPHLQLQSPDTLLLSWKEHYAHLTGRDGHPGKRGVHTATRIIECLDAFHPRSMRQNVFLAGIWYDCKNPNVEVYLVTEPAAGKPYAQQADVTDGVYQNVLSKALEVGTLAATLEEGQSIGGGLAEFWYTGGADYEHPINKFYGRSGLLRGLAAFDGGCGSVGLEEYASSSIWLSHPEEVTVHSFADFQEARKNPPRGRYSVSDALNWGMITKEKLRQMIEEAVSKKDETKI